MRCCRVAVLTGWTALFKKCNLESSKISKSLPIMECMTANLLFLVTTACQHGFAPAGSLAASLSPALSPGQSLDQGPAASQTPQQLAPVNPLSAPVPPDSAQAEVPGQGAAFNGESPESVLLPIPGPHQDQRGLAQDSLAPAPGALSCQPKASQVKLLYQIKIP